MEEFHTLTRIILQLHRENNNRLTWRPDLFSDLGEEYEDALYYLRSELIQQGLIYPSKDDPFFTKLSFEGYVFRQL